MEVFENICFGEIRFSTSSLIGFKQLENDAMQLLVQGQSAREERERSEGRSPLFLEHDGAAGKDS